MSQAPAFSDLHDPVEAVDEVDPGPSGETDPADESAELESDLPDLPIGDAFADAVISFSPGEGAGFGADGLPDIVLGAPRGAGALAGSLHVLSLGRGGEVVLSFDGERLLDGPGVDLLVFENPFPGWVETGEVAASADGVQWSTWPCAAGDADGGWPGCAGLTPVLSHPDNGIDPTDPTVAGGDGFDLADLGLGEARYVRVRDSGLNDYFGFAGGFDLDAVVAVHWGAPSSL